MTRPLSAKEFDSYRKRKKGIEDDFLRDSSLIDRSQPGWEKSYVDENAFANARVKALRVGFGQDSDYNKALRLTPLKKRKRRVK